IYSELLQRVMRRTTTCDVEAGCGILPYATWRLVCGILPTTRGAQLRRTPADRAVAACACSDARVRLQRVVCVM
ncbi:hypothetical protein HAX54_038615, partial [Datura stramonium]|nr:hypothetical protein [Datura stramonium]